MCIVVIVSLVNESLVNLSHVNLYQVEVVVKPSQVKMARAGLGLKLDELAKLTGIHRNTIHNFEKGLYAGDPVTIEKIKSALEKAGIEFISENGGGEGVRMRKSTD